MPPYPGTILGAVLGYPVDVDGKGLDIECKKQRTGWVPLQYPRDEFDNLEGNNLMGSTAVLVLTWCECLSIGGFSANMWLQSTARRSGNPAGVVQSG